MKKQKVINIPSFEDCAFKVECLPEDIPIRGNASAIDEETDNEIAKEIERKLNGGNDWAWCCVRVVCYYDAGLDGIEGDDYLGACSYESEKDFVENSGYFEDMKQRAYDDFVKAIDRL